MKFRIAICDNDEMDLERNHNLVNRYLREHLEVDGEITEFQSPLHLLQTLEQGSYDAYLLDIMMPEMSGIQLGQKIREKSKRVPIIYMTSSREFAFEAYGVQAMFYLEKPVNYQKLSEALDIVVELSQKEKENKILVNTRQGVVTLDANHVMYVENESRSAVYFLNDDTKIVSVSNRRSFEESVEDISKNKNFIQPHKSYYVNMQYIKIIRQTSIFLDNNTEIPISRKHLTEIRKLYLDYMTEENGLE